VIQFDRVPWLAPHMRELVGELLQGAAAGLDPAAVRTLGRRLIGDPRDVVRRLLRGELARLLADPAQLGVLDRLQAAMSVIEGHAEHVMDAAAGELGAGIADLRGRLDRRRARRGGLGDVVGRLLGLDLKLRQYELGKSFCDAVVTTSGSEALTAVWRSPADLPDMDELEDPERWLDRVARASSLAA
jgi:putative hydrolase